ncbi:MAG: discoidin domain-containing protein, partial [Phycisphaeraceae bacterium]
MKRYMHLAPAVALIVSTMSAAYADAPSAEAGAVYNLKVVTDASPDYTDIDSLVHSTTSRWESDEDKMWALFYWQHKGRRQTNPMTVHGQHETDPIRQYNDYGYMMCSTISGVNVGIWQYMGYPAKYYDIGVHSVPEVFYDGGWHHYDNSLSLYYTLCDGETVAGVEDVGKTLACEASGGKEEPGHIAIYHAVHGTSVNGFIEGSDTIRDLKKLGQHSFAPGALKYRYYVTYAEIGHRYILNLRDGESYTRHYTRQDRPEGANDRENYQSDPAYFTPNGANSDGSPRDPEAKNVRYRIRGNGDRTFEPALTPEAVPGSLHSGRNIEAIDGGGLQPVTAGEPAEAVFKVEGANVITSLAIAAELVRGSDDDRVAIAISTTNGMTWQEVYNGEATGSDRPAIRLVDEVNGVYDVLVKVQLTAAVSPDQAQLKRIRFDTVTQINSKTQPQLLLGKNTVYVGAGEQTGSIVVWPELQNDRYKDHAVESVHIRTKEKHEDWNGVMGVAGDAPGGEGYVVFRVDAPADLTRITQGARMYVRKSGAQVRFEHSFDEGKTWTESFAFSDTEAPWDDLQNQVTTDVPDGARSVLFKYHLKDASFYSIRMEANHERTVSKTAPVEVTFNWSERQQDYSVVPRSHTQLVDELPATYTINVGGFDHPVVDSLTVNTRGARGEVAYGYSDGEDLADQNPEKFVGQWVTYGNNLAEGKPYTLSLPPDENSWDAGDPDGTALTDGRVGSSYSGGVSYREGPLWTKGRTPEIVVDLGEPQQAAAFRVHLHGYPSQDAVRGRVQDEVEVLVSNDGENFTSVG